MKLSRQYSTQTPFTVEIVSDVFLTISQGVTGYAIFADNEVLAWISLGTGLIGKVLARFVRKSDVQKGLDDSDIGTNSDSTRNESTE